MNRRSILGAAGAALIAPQAAAAGRAGWRAVFDGQSLKGWSIAGDANWRVERGAATADHGKGGFLVSDDVYDNLEFRAEAWVDDAANSGVFLRISNPAAIAASSAYECNIWDGRPDPTYGTGAIVNFAKVTTPTRTVGRWTRIHIIFDGPHLVMKLDDRVTADVTDTTYARGPIALQYGGGVVKFRHIQIKAL